MIVNGSIIKYNAVVCVFTLLSLYLYSQDTVEIRTYEVAILKFHVQDTCPCAYTTEYSADSSFVRKNKMIKISVDTVLFFNYAGCELDNNYLCNEINYLSLADTMYLSRDTHYYASIDLGLNMGYIILNYIISKLFIPKVPKGQGVLSGFPCDENYFSSEPCEGHLRYFRHKMSECLKKYQNQ